MFIRADSMTVDTDEGEFTLVIECEQYPREDPITVNIHNIDLDAFYDQVKARIGPYLQGKEAARRTWTPSAIAEFERVVAIREDGSYRMEPDEDPYDPSDPKHHSYHDNMADLWDNREKV